MPSFRTLRRTDILRSAGSRVTVGTSRSMSAARPRPWTSRPKRRSSRRRAASGRSPFPLNRSRTPLSNRSFTALADLAPGVTVHAAAGTRANMSTNFTMDGISTMDTGSNTVLLQMNTESIAEVKLLVSGYQAEYGRSSGLQVMAVTKSGTNRFRGSVYDVERNSDWNANSRTNILNELPKTISKQKDWGYSIGGPIEAGRQQQAFSSIRSSSAAHGRQRSAIPSASRPRSSAPATSRRPSTTTAISIPTSRTRN